MAWFAWGTTSCIVGLWAGPYLSDVHGLDTLGRGKVLFWIACGVIAGGLTFTYIDRRSGRTKRLIVAGTVVNIAVFGVLSLLPSPGLVTVTALLALMGFVGGYSVLIATHGRSFYPERLIGRGITTVNCAVLFGAASLQVSTGVIVSALSYAGAPIPQTAFRAMFAALAIVLGAALVCYQRCPDGRVVEPGRGRA